MSRLLFPALFVLLIPCIKYTESKSQVIGGDWFGNLNIKPYNFRLYLSVKHKSYQLFILNPKANQIQLDTLFFKNDTLFFRREDHTAAFTGKHNRQSNSIHGQWIFDDHKKYPVVFESINTDTLTGFHPRSNKTYAYKKPVQQIDGLKTCDLREHPVKSHLLDSLTYKIIDETFPNIHSLLIAKNNCLLYEEYFYGWKPNDLWLIQSVTKSLTGALTGIALSKGEINGVNERMCNYLPDYRDKACNEQNKNITLHQLLNMSTGLDWNELEFDYYDERNTANQCGKVPDPFDCVLSRSRVNSSMPVFAYNSMNHLIVNKVLRKATGMRNPKELKKRLLRPLGVEKFKTGGESFGVMGDISVIPRDMLKFGILYLNGGVWNGKQIVPASWVKESTATKIQIGPEEGYGYFWWTKQFNVNTKIVDSFYAWGYAGQYIFVVPSLELVVVITGSNWTMDEKKYAFAMMGKFILPALSTD